MMKEKIVAKVDEHINRLLEKPELTNEEYMILKERLRELKWAEEETARRIEWEDKLKPVMEMVFKPSGFGGGGCVH